MSSWPFIYLVYAATETSARTLSVVDGRLDILTGTMDRFQTTPAPESPLLRFPDATDTGATDRAIDDEVEREAS